LFVAVFTAKTQRKTAKVAKKRKSAFLGVLVFLLRAFAVKTPSR